MRRNAHILTIVHDGHCIYLFFNTFRTYSQPFCEDGFVSKLLLIMTSFPNVIMRVSCLSGGSEEHTSITSEGDIISETSWGNRVTIESVPYAVLMEANSVLVESYPVPGKLKTEVGTELANRFEWRYYLRGQSGGKLKPGEGTAFSSDRDFVSFER